MAVREFRLHLILVDDRNFYLKEQDATLTLLDTRRAEAAQRLLQIELGVTARSVALAGPAEENPTKLRGITAEVLQTLAGYSEPLHVGEIATLLGCAEGAAGSAVTRLRRYGYITQVGMKGRRIAFLVSPAGHAYLVERTS